MDTNNITSNRSKGCTVFAIVQLLSSIASYFGISNNTAKIYYNNAEALWYPNYSKVTYTTLTARDIDLKLEV